MSTGGQIEDRRPVALLDQLLRDPNTVRVDAAGPELPATGRNIVDIKSLRKDLRSRQQGIAVAKIAIHTRRQVMSPKVEDLAVVFIHLLHDTLWSEASPVLDHILDPGNIPAHARASLLFSFCRLRE